MTYILLSCDFAIVSWRLIDVWTSLFGIMNQYDPMFVLKINVGHCDLYFIVQWFCVIFGRLFDVWTSYIGIMGQHARRFDLKINVGHCDLYFMVQWFCLISWRLFDICTSYFGIVNQYDPRFDLKINVGNCDLYFIVILPCILNIIWCMNNIISDYDSVWPDVWPKNKCRSVSPIFHGPVICVISWRLFDVWTSYFGIMGQFDPTFDLKINVGLCDLYFMVQWFCLISPWLLDGWVLYIQIMKQCDPNFDLKVNISQQDLYFMV